MQTKGNETNGAAAAKHLLREGGRKIQNNSRLSHPNLPPSLLQTSREGTGWANQRLSWPRLWAFLLGAGGREAPGSDEDGGSVESNCGPVALPGRVWWRREGEEGGEGSEANTLRALWVSTAQSKALKKTKPKKKNWEESGRTQTRLNSQETFCGCSQSW